MTDINESIKKFGYTPEDFFTTMNNYLSAIYAIKQATSSIKESIETKVKLPLVVFTRSSSVSIIKLGSKKKYGTVRSINAGSKLRLPRTLLVRIHSLPSVIPQ